MAGDNSLFCHWNSCFQGEPPGFVQHPANPSQCQPLRTRNTGQLWHKLCTLAFLVLTPNPCKWQHAPTPCTPSLSSFACKCIGCQTLETKQEHLSATAKTEKADTTCNQARVRKPPSKTPHPSMPRANLPSRCIRPTVTNTYDATTKRGTNTTPAAN